VISFKGKLRFFSLILLFIVLFNGSNVYAEIPTNPEKVLPKNNVLTNKPTLVWHSVEGATEYNIYLDNGEVNLLLPSVELGCSSENNLCKYELPRALSDGYHRWWVKAKNSFGESSWGIQFNFNVITSLDKPILNAPIGLVSGNTLTFQWGKVDNATDYKIYIDGGSINQWVSSSDVCPQYGYCSYTTTINLPDGNYRWWVKAKNTTVESDWGSQLLFTVATTLTEKPSLVSPSGNISQSDTFSRIFSWEPVSGASYYSIYFDYGTQGHAPVSKTIQANQSTCRDGISLCQIVLLDNVHLEADTYRWWVKAGNSSGETDWSYVKIFTMVSVTAPQKVSGFSVDQRESSILPSFEWDAVKGATEYQMYIDGGSIYQWFTAEELGCAVNLTCRYQAVAELKFGKVYRWWVRAKNSNGEIGPWGGPSSVATPVRPELRLNSPFGRITPPDGKPVFKWYPFGKATRYQFYMYNFYQQDKIWNIWLSPAELGCEDGISLCQYTILDSLRAENYSQTNTQVTVDYVWSVRAEKSSGKLTSWGSRNDGSSDWPLIQVAYPAIQKTKTELISPKGLTNTSVIFSWRPVEGNTEYQIEVRDNQDNIVINQTLSRELLGCSNGVTLCHYAVNNSLINGNSYQWRVKATEWSDYSAFSVDSRITEKPFKFSLKIHHPLWKRGSNFTDFKISSIGTYEVDCDNDGVFEITNNQYITLCSYNDNDKDIVTISMKGDFNKFVYTLDGGSSIFSIDQWGTQQWQEVPTVNGAIIAAFGTPNHQ
jgi:uncharacterized protein YegP (UPF0339 family)